MRRRWVVAGLVVVVSVVAVVFWPRGPQPCRATFEQVREGMTFEDVCATVGGPPGDYTPGRYVSLPGSSWRMFCERWASGDCELLVAFNDDGTARFLVVEPRLPLPDQPSPFDRLCSRLGL